MIKLINKITHYKFFVVSWSVSKWIILGYFLFYITNMRSYLILQPRLTLCHMWEVINLALKITSMILKSKYHFCCLFFFILFLYFRELLITILFTLWTFLFINHSLFINLISFNFSPFLFLLKLVCFIHDYIQVCQILWRVGGDSI